VNDLVPAISSTDNKQVKGRFCDVYFSGGKTVGCVDFDLDRNSLLEG
jgi:hypothetical protein